MQETEYKFLHIPYARNKVALGSFIRQGPRFFNILPEERTTLSNIKKF